MNLEVERSGQPTMPYLQFTHNSMPYTIDYCKKLKPEDPPEDLDKLPELDLNFTRRRYELLWRFFVDPGFHRYTCGAGTTVASVINIFFTLLLCVTLMVGYIYTYRTIAGATPEQVRVSIILWCITGSVWLISTAIHLGIRLIKGVLLFRHKDYTVKGDYSNLFVTPRRDGILKITVDGRELKYIYRKDKKKEKKVVISSEQSV